MNKFQKELLKKCKKISLLEEVPLFDDIFILPTQRKHDSGYKIMNIVGLDRKDNKYYWIDSYCDVVNLGEWESKIKGLNIDIGENGIIHFWSNYQRFKSIFRVSSCTFEMVDRKNPIWSIEEK